MEKDINIIFIKEETSEYKLFVKIENSKYKEYIRANDPIIKMENSN